jgi:hypothetical protein
MKQIYAFFKKSQINNPSPADCRGQAGLAGAKTQARLFEPVDLVQPV